MRVYVSVKQAGKRKDFLTKKQLILKEPPMSLRELITETIRVNVTEYNNRTVEALLVKYLTSDEIEAQAQTGKISFGERWNSKQADEAEAIETAIVAFTDGLFRVFIGDKEITALDEPLEIKDEDVLTFIRFMMLAGRMW